MKYTLEKQVKTAGGQCAIGSDNVYEWQLHGGTNLDISEAIEFAKKFEPLTLRLIETETGQPVWSNGYTH